MSRRGAELTEKVVRQIDDIADFFVTLSQADLAKPRPPGEASRKSGHVAGGRTLGDAAAHIAEGYHFILRFLRSAGYVSGAPVGGSIHGRGPAPIPSELRKRLAEAKTEVGIIADLTDEQLDSVPPPKSSRFSDGRRTLEQLIEKCIGHQAQHLIDLKGAVASPARAGDAPDG